MPIYAYPAKNQSGLKETLKSYAQLRASIRQAVANFQKLNTAYRAQLEALEAESPTILEFSSLEKVNATGKEHLEAIEQIEKAQQSLQHLTAILSKELPYATKDLLRRGNKILITDETGGDAGCLLCYETEMVYTREYVVESVAFEQDVAEIIIDVSRMRTTEQLLQDPSIKHFFPPSFL